MPKDPNETQDLNSLIQQSRAGRLFWKTTAYPKTALALSIAAIAVGAGFLPGITLDASSEAFMEARHPAVVYRQKVKDTFGLSDPVIVAVVANGAGGIFTPHSLELIKWMTEQTAAVANVDPERVTSIATENNIVGTADGMVVEPFYEEPPVTQQEADAVREAVLGFPLYAGSLVASDGTAALIVAELLDESQGSTVYRSLLELAEKAPVEGEEIHVAGEGAAREYLGTYIDSDAKRLNPIGFVFVSGILFIAYRTARGVLLPNLVVMGAVCIGLGSMAGFGVPFYVITNGLPVILIAISVADAVHILGQYYEDLQRWPDATSRELAVHATAVMWRPVLITSLTDIAGFLALSAASTMPPMQAFGVFASIGCAAALLLSLVSVPAALTMLKPRPSKAFARPASAAGTVNDRFGNALGAFGRAVMARPRAIIAAGCLISVAGFLGARRVEVNDERIGNFRQSEPIYQADKTINEKLDGTHYLDVMIETQQSEGILDPARLRKIAALQRSLESLPHVKGSTSIVDYLKQMNKAVNENRPEEYRIPDSSDLAAQYLLLYGAAGDPTDFEEELDYEYRLANVRATLDTGRFSELKQVVEQAEQYVQDEFNTADMTATLSGRVKVNYHWIGGIGESHFRGVALALVAVWMMASVSFRSPVLGSLAVIPVSMAVLLIYAVMGYSEIWLGVATSMFAAIAIGTGVDFAVHVLDRIIVDVRDEGRTIDQALVTLFPSTGRALLFNSSAVVIGFGILTLSEVPPLVWFGTLVTVAALVSFLASLTLLPAIVQVFPATVSARKIGAVSK